MIRARILWRVLWMIGATGACVSICLAAPAKNINVRLINARSGKPLSKVQVSMSMWNGTLDIHRPPSPSIENISAASDSKGVVHFNLPGPFPEHVGFDIGGPRNFAGGWRLINDSPVEILKTGLAADYKEAKCGKLKTTPCANPGAVIIVDTPLWDVVR